VAGLCKPDVVRAEESVEYVTEERCFILELANDNHDPKASIARARVTPGVTTVQHRVRATEERYVIIGGQGIAEIGGLEPQRVGPGDVVRIPAGRPQRITNIGNEDLVFLCICTPRFEWRNYESLE
jgi:mannose-6-phosphate isomerase-like protein (cupin superfamily)